jgi:predicted lipid carrier protein YhbT
VPLAVDDELRSLVARVEGVVREPVGSSYHLHQLDGANLEAMVYLDPGGARIEWVHGKGTCAISGEGAAILALLRGEQDPDALEVGGRLVLYGDRDLIGAAARVFSP